MAQARKEKKEETPQFLIGRSPDHHLLYADGVRLVMGGYDVKLILSTNEKTPDGRSMITEHLTLVLSPQHAKDLAAKLTEQMEEYEKNFMPLQFTDTYNERLEERRKALERLVKTETFKDAN